MIGAADLIRIPHRGSSTIDPGSGFVFTGVSTDSRTIRSGELFVALRGPSFDGHRFIGDVFRSGAAAAIVDEHSDFRHWHDWPLLVVRDTTAAFGLLARNFRRRFSIPVIAIGGSNGKTTTREMCGAVLRSGYSVLSNEANHNNQIGVPQTLLRLTGQHDMAVIELGTNHPGEIRTLCAICEPTHGILTNIGREHLEYFRTLSGVTREERALFTWLRRHSGIAFVNDDDRRVRNSAEGVKRTVRYGFDSARSAVRGTDVRIDRNGHPSITIRQRSRAPFRLRLPVPGRHMAANALAASAVGLHFGISGRKIKAALETWNAVGKRMEVVTAGGITILNDSYNANPDSVLAALDTIRSMPCTGRRIVVLGDMLELGDASGREHARVGSAVGSEEADILFTFGPMAKIIAGHSMIAQRYHFDDKAALLDAVAGCVSPGDIVLIKGSRGMKMEEAVTALVRRMGKQS